MSRLVTNRKRGIKARSSIAARTTQLAWTITLGGLGLFMAFVIPEQKQNLKGGLESKGQSIAAALQDEVASAAATEDYSSVVEHAMQVVQGDPTVEFLVITKLDGYSMVVKRDGWTMVPKIDGYWYEGPRKISSGIGMESIVGKRVFHFRYPLDCMGMPWGWLHIGLSLNSYNKSVRASYVRTALAGGLCIVLSLLASMLFARRFARPILDLRNAVEKVARGDLAVRAQARTHDELELLSDAFNEMTEAILERNRIVEMVRFAAQSLQGAEDWDTVIDGVIARFGQAAGISRVILVEVDHDADGAVVPKVRLEWSAEGIPPYGQIWAGRTAKALGNHRRCVMLAEGRLLIERRAELEAEPFVCPDPPPFSTLTAPIFAEQQFWGSLALQDCGHDREWSDVTKDSIRVIAEMVGASIVRQRSQRALVAAKSDLEQKVAARTAELEEQIQARDKAHRDLQLMQKQLMEASRYSGMAEVATGVLHNVGNVLNSVNVSASLLMDHLDSSRVTKLEEVSRMLEEHSWEIGQFLAADPKGRRIVPYLAKLSVHLKGERDLLRKETEGLIQNVGHIKEVVSMQQGYARSYGVLEKVSPAELVEDALNLSAAAIDRHRINVVRQLEPVGTMTTDRHKILQILLNLIQNSKDAVKKQRAEDRRIVVRLRPCAGERVAFQVEDNGVGIAAENLTKIFSHGFTTKKDGHGFGLHSGALAASELGGSLRAESVGAGQGAVFTLDLPMNGSVKPERGGLR